jgi:predicted negative regulator of RcsB-dependent stress response
MAVELYDEHEQGERVRRWIKEYSPAIIVGLILAFGGIFGFGQWQEYRAGQQALASQYYQAVGQALTAEDLDRAASEYQTMIDNVGDAAYSELAGMRLASAFVEDGRLGRAAEIYRRILDSGRLEALEPVATLRLARILEAQGDTESALSLLSGEAPDGFEASWNETRGDLLFAQGDLEDARAAWQLALERRQADGNSTRLLELKIDSAGTGGTS